jgi:predicted lysophospholipase L1 biosynthesis ABC-type transport system permease subunit
MEPALMQRLVHAAASSFAILCFALGLIGSAFDEASAADALLPIGVPHALSWSWALHHVLWFAIANLVVAAGIFAMSDWIAARRRARVLPPRRERREPRF